MAKFKVVVESGELADESAADEIVMIGCALRNVAVNTHASTTNQIGWIGNAGAISKVAPMPLHRDNCHNNSRSARGQILITMNGCVILSNAILELRGGGGAAMKRLEDWGEMSKRSYL